MSRKKHKNLKSSDAKNSETKEESQMDIIFKDNKKHKTYVALVAAAFFAIGFFVSMGLGTTGLFVKSSPAPVYTQSNDLSTLSPQNAAQKAVSFINNYILQQGVTASAASITEKNGVYEIVLAIKGPQGTKNFTSYVTRDGKLLFVSAIDLEEKPQTQQQNQQQQTNEVPKTDKPKVNVFVMSYCPFGLQMEKAVIPVMKLLGSKADIEINYVSYIMHGKKEIDENLRQYCIQKEQGDKFVDYLECFVQNGDYKKCLTDAGIDTSKLDSCISVTDEQYNITGLYNDKSTWSAGRYPQFPIDSSLNAQYGVRGSPTFVINGKTVRVNRSPEAVKEAICSAFTNAPEECNETLSDSAESPGIGPLSQKSTSGSGGGCGA